MKISEFLEIHTSKFELWQIQYAALLISQLPPDQSFRDDKVDELLGINELICTNCELYCLWKDKIWEMLRNDIQIPYFKEDFDNKASYVYKIWETINRYGNKFVRQKGFSYKAERIARNKGIDREYVYGEFGEGYDN